MFQELNKNDKAAEAVNDLAGIANKVWKKFQSLYQAQAKN